MCEPDDSTCGTQHSLQDSPSPNLSKRIRYNSDELTSQVSESECSSPVPVYKPEVPTYGTQLSAQESPPPLPKRTCYNSDELANHVSKSVCLSPVPDLPYMLCDVHLSDLTLNGISRTVSSIAHDYSIVDLSFTSNTDIVLDTFLSHFYHIFMDTYTLIENLFVKISFCIHVIMFQTKRGVVFNRKVVSFSIPMLPIFDVTFDSVQNYFLNEADNFLKFGSNWEVGPVVQLTMSIAEYDSIQRAGKCNSQNLQLPKSLRDKHAVVNVLNLSNDCFKYALLSVLHYEDVHHNRFRATVYNKWLNEHDWSGINWPMTAAQITNFEKQNPGLVINLLEWREKDKHNPVHRIRLAPIPKSTDQDVVCVSIMAVELLDKSWHYVGVTNLDRLLKKGGRHTYCERCFTPLYYDKPELKSKVMIDHKKRCYSDKPGSTKMPTNLDLHFKNWCKTQRLPYVLYADCECYLEENPNHPENIKHIPIAVGLLLVAHPKMKNEPLKEPYRVFSGPQSMLEACQYIDQIAKDVYQWNKKYTNVELRMNHGQNQEFTNTKYCFICKKAFDNKGIVKVREHDHLTGEYRGAACQKCNTKMRLKRNILPVFFHNGRNYDNHLICQHALADMKEWNVSVIPQTKEKYISMQVKREMGKYFCPTKKAEKRLYMNIEIKDSAQFLLASLDSLVKNLDEKNLVYSSKCQPDSTVFDITHVKAKGFFPYEWFNSIEKLEYKSLPTREEFYDKLNCKECSEEDYEFAQKAWQDFGCETFADYMFSYLKRDVHQLADVFETFRDLAMNEDGLDPAQYYTLPGLTLDSALKLTGTNINLLAAY